MRYQKLRDSHSVKKVEDAEVMCHELSSLLIPRPVAYTAAVQLYRLSGCF